MQQAIDTRIKQAQRRGAGIYILSGLFTIAVLLGFIFWLFLVKGYSLLIGPADATANAKLDLISGFAWVSDRRIYTLGGEVIVSVSAPTFETTELMIDGQTPSSLEIVLLPSPAFIKAEAFVSPQSGGQSEYLSESQWFLNGTLIHVGAELSYKTPPGAYQLDLTNRFYESTSQRLELARAEQVTLKVGLKRVEGTITVDSVPQGIDVSVNGNKEGITPLMIKAAGGQYKLSLTSAQYNSIQDTVDVLSKYLHPSRNYQLVPKAGLININASPNDGLLLINNIEYELGSIELPANRSHKIEYKKAGYASYTKQITLNINESLNLQVVLEPLYGQVTINTNVPAQVSINGKNEGNSPVSKRLLSVAAQLEVSADGYRSVKQSFVPKPNASTSLDINLLTEFDARRQERKPLFVNTIGISMQKFRGDAFTLGSAANETGRRRNEHQVNVDFARPFWVSEKEITQTQFTASLGANQGIKSELPVTGISWFEAAKYCNWLSQQEGLPVFYRFQNGVYRGFNQSSNGYRLPTEAEWEWLAKKAKRALSTVYVWGNQESLRDNQGNFADKSINGKQLIFFEDYTDGKTGLAEVGSFKADRAGLYDLDGNVSEWVHDFYTTSIPDNSKIQVDYMGARSGETFVIKGGNYETGRLRELRAAYREFSASGKDNVGFRIARYDRPQ